MSMPMRRGSSRRVGPSITGLKTFRVSAASPSRPTRTAPQFDIIKGFSAAPPQPPAPGTPGHVGWRELHAGDLEKDFAFYAGLFGWTKAEAMDMGPMGIYQLVAIGGVPAGAMMNKTKETPAPFWLFYFNVDNIDAGAKRVTDRGGQILFGPVEVPGGSWIVQCRDPQGAMFALLGPRR